MTALGEPTLLFTCEFDERTALEVEQKGWFGHAIVSFPDGTRVPVFFYDPVRLSQDLNSVRQAGKACIAEPAMIIVPQVTRDFMEAAVEQLYGEGFFGRLLGRTE